MVIRAISMGDYDLFIKKNWMWFLKLSEISACLQYGWSLDQYLIVIMTDMKK